MGDVVAKPPEADTPAQSFPERLMGIFISPVETLADVARKPDFILPLVLLVVMAVAGTEVFLHKIGIEPVLRWAYEHSSRTANMSPEQLQAMLERAVPITIWTTRVGAFLWIPFVVLLGAVIGLVSVNGIFGARITFKTAFSVSSYAYAVNIIYSLIALTMTLFGDPDHFISNPQNPTPTSVGFFLNPNDVRKPLLALGSSVEIFTIWNIALLALGCSVASGRKAKTVPLFFTFLGLWIVKVLIVMGLSSLG
jgi:hypothetical protein